MNETDKPKIRISKEALDRPKPRRFYKQAGVRELPPDAATGGAALYQVVLDGRPVRTPRKAALAMPYRALAEAIAEEWGAQGEVIDPATMPLTRFANSILDGVIGREPEVRADILKYAGSDLLCYRAEGPASLVQRQAAAWDRVLAWAREVFNARLVLTAGVMPVAQPDHALVGIAAALEELDAYRLTSIHVMTTLTGSALLALALSANAATPDAVWDAAHVDEDHNMQTWGRDEQAMARRDVRAKEFDAAVRILQLLPRVA